MLGGPGRAKAWKDVREKTTFRASVFHWPRSQNSNAWKRETCRKRLWDAWVGVEKRQNPGEEAGAEAACVEAWDAAGALAGRGGAYSMPRPSNSSGLK